MSCHAGLGTSQWQSMSGSAAACLPNAHQIYDIDRLQIASGVLQPRSPSWFFKVTWAYQWRWHPAAALHLACLDTHATICCFAVAVQLLCRLSHPILCMQLLNKQGSPVLQACKFSAAGFLRPCTPCGKGYVRGKPTPSTQSPPTHPSSTTTVQSTCVVKACDPTHQKMCCLVHSPGTRC